MSSVTLTHQDGEASIVINGSFVFELNRAFRDAYRSVPAGTPVTIDLSAADYIDSAGLGMLIRLREHVGGDVDNLTLTGANPTVKKILEVANFGLLFTIT